MATKLCVAKTMAVLGATFPRDITPELVAIYADALHELTDAELEQALRRAVGTCRFFPVPAELLELAGTRRAAAVDIEAVLERIRGLFSYLPTRGDTPPSVGRVRDALGDGIAQAYGSVGGGDRLYSGNETTRSIARRDFAEEIKGAIRDLGAAAVLEPMQKPLALPPAESLVIHGTRPDRYDGPRLLRSAPAISKESA